MAYSGGFVFADGKRLYRNEDPLNHPGPHHSDVVIGSGEVQITGYRMIPTLYVLGQERSINAYLLTDCDFWEPTEHAWFGKIRGHVFGGIKYGRKERNEVVEFFLIEPGKGEATIGKTWTTTFGFMIGGGWEDNINARQEVVRPVQDWKQLFKRLRDTYPSELAHYFKGKERPLRLDALERIRKEAPEAQ